MKTYTFHVVVEPDEDKWLAYCPALNEYAAATWGYTREEALRHIREVVRMVLLELVEDQEPIPDESSEEALISSKSKVAITI